MPELAQYVLAISVALLLAPTIARMAAELVCIGINVVAFTLMAPVFVYLMIGRADREDIKTWGIVSLCCVGVWPVVGLALWL